MSEPEAIATLLRQLVAEQGFIARLSRGEGMDYDGLREAYGALDALEREWADRDTVPKAAVLPMIDVYSRVFATALLYPGKEEEIEGIAGDLALRIEAVTLPQRSRMSEDEAAALVLAHLGGQSSLALDLHQRQRPDLSSFKDLQDAITTLERAWAGRDSVPRIIAAPMLGAGSMIREHAEWYPDLRAKLEALADELTAEVRRCLSS